MMRFFGLILIALSAPAVAGAAELSAADREKIESALPSKAPAKPRSARRLLLLNVNVNDTGRRPDIHASIPHGNYAIEMLGRKTGAYTSVLRTDVEALRPENLKQFDAICFNNTTGVLTTDPVLRDSLLSFVANGKGFVAFHAGGAATFVQYPKYDQFPAFGEMVGGYENGGHPWQPRDTVYLRVEDPSHPLTRVFNGRDFPVQDQIFQFQEQYSREKVRVLLSVNLEKSDFDPNKRRFLPARLADKDFPVAWIKPYKKGRVFYNSLGHNPAVFSHPQLLEHFLAGIQYALGDLEADATPGLRTAAGQKAAPAQANADELLRQIAKSEFDQDREAQFALSALVAKAQGSPDQMRELEKRFLAALKPDATLAGKDFICRQLGLIGSEASVAVLSGLLLDPKTADIARYALHRIPGPGVDRGLRSALAKTSGVTRIGIINTLGQRRDTDAVPALRRLAMGTDQATAAAAAYALAEIADSAALDALSDALAKTSGEIHLTVAEASLKAAGRIAASGGTAPALSLYRKLYAPGEPPVVRAGALRGLASASGSQSTPLLLEALRDQRPGLLQNAAIDALLRIAPGEAVSQMPKLAEAAQVRVLSELAARGDASALPVFTAALKSSSQPVRVAALEGMARVGNASIVPTLAATAAGEDQAEQAAARSSLGRLKGDDVDRALIAAMESSAEPKVRLELIRAAGERGASAAAPALLQLARDPSPEVRRESLRALRDSASGSHIPGLLELVLKPAQRGDRAEAVRSLAAVLRRSDSSRFADVLSAFTAAGDLESRTALMQVMGQSGNPTALPLLRGSLKEEDSDLKRAAILALTNWPDATPIPDLLEAARTASNPAHQVLALRGVLRLVGSSASARPPRESVKLLAAVMSLAKQADEKRSVLALLPRFPTPEALELARASLNDSQVAAESQEAVNRLERRGRR